MKSILKHEHLTMTGSCFSECSARQDLKKKNFSKECTDVDLCAVEGACGMKASSCPYTLCYSECAGKIGFQADSNNKCEFATNKVAIVVRVVVSLVFLFLLVFIIDRCFHTKKSH